jgi:hypothetical protein
MATSMGSDARLASHLVVSLSVQRLNVPEKGKVSALFCFATKQRVDRGTIAIVRGARGRQRFALESPNRPETPREEEFALPTAWAMVRILFPKNRPQHRAKAALGEKNAGELAVGSRGVFRKWSAPGESLRSLLALARVFGWSGLKPLWAVMMAPGARPPLLRPPSPVGRESPLAATERVT